MSGYNDLSSGRRAGRLMLLICQTVSSKTLFAQKRQKRRIALRRGFMCSRYFLVLVLGQSTPVNSAFCLHKYYRSCLCSCPSHLLQGSLPTSQEGVDSLFGSRLGKLAKGNDPDGIVVRQHLFINLVGHVPIHGGGSDRHSVLVIHIKDFRMAGQGNNNVGIANNGAACNANLFLA